MRILQLCSKPPLPAIDGGCIAMNNLSQSILQLGHELKILSVSTHKHPFVEDSYTKEYLEKTSFEHVYIDTRVNIVDAFASLITQDNYNVSRFFSVDFDLVLRKALKKKKFDVVIMESLFMTPYLHTIRRFSRAKVVLRSHNLEFFIWQRLALQEQNKAKKIYLKYLANQLKIYELQLINQIDGLIAISNNDRDKYKALGCKVNMVNIPLGIDVLTYSSEVKERAIPTLFHIGAMDWTPNQEGITWFLNDVWPIVLSELPSVELFLAGKDLKMYAEKLQGDFTNVTVVGEVNSAKDFMAEHSIMIVPLLSGGGIRIKIIEGMAMGKPVVSTKIGAEGIDAKHGKQILLATDAKEFAEHILSCLRNKELLTEMGQNARKFVEKSYSFEAINKQLHGFLTSISHAETLKQEIA